MGAQWARLTIVATLAGMLLWGSTAVARSPQPLPNDHVALVTARAFYRAAKSSDAAKLKALAALPFSFDGERIQTPEHLAQRLKQLQARVAKHQLAIRRIVGLSPADAIARWGDPPKRVAGAVRDAQVLAFIRLGSSGGAVLLLKRIQGDWRVVGLTD